VNGGREATPDDRGTRGIQETPDKRATPDDRVTRAIREIRDKRAIKAIEASPLHAPKGSITTRIRATEG
jgi:hypothetical protein